MYTAVMTTKASPSSKRKRPMVSITLSVDGLIRLDLLAGERGQSRSGTVEQLVREARLRADAYPPWASIKPGLPERAPTNEQTPKGRAAR
jgi:hypothetical protein